MGTDKQRSIYLREDLRKFDFFSFSRNTSFTLQLLQLSDAMRPDDDSCKDKMKEMDPRSKFYDLKVCNFSEIQILSYPLDRYSKLFLNAYINRHVNTGYLKMIYFYSPLGIWHVFLCSINTNKNVNTYHFRSLLTCCSHFIP